MHASDFLGGPGYLNSASVGLPPRSAREELAGATERWHKGRIQPPEFDQWVERARSSFARINGVDPATVAIGANVSSFVGLVAGSLPRGARVVGYRGEFSSLLFPFMARGDLDVHLVELEELAGAVDARTALAVVSAAQSSDGRLAALDDIAATGARTLVDTTQAAGWLALDASRFDYTVCAAYKWLLSPRGTAFMTVRPERMDELVPAAAGWYAGELPWESVYGPEMRLAAGARRFDLSPSWLSWVGTAPALEYLEHTGIEAVHAHDVGLADALRERLHMPPAGSAIVSVDRPGAAERLAEAGIVAAVRDGRARVGFHLYNTASDVDAVVAALG
ncbi:MAG TPA: aminotransferase class V-fold PLP-dependent enzyme [Thermoleophilaceae bacterium]|nr:aminotransferase class V-fold PLP-dependent enzyme [Thermoleophilaceae bacterium]